MSLATMYATQPSTSTAVVDTQVASTSVAVVDPDTRRASIPTCAADHSPTHHKPSLLRTILLRLQDNRLQSGDEEMARKLQELNREQEVNNALLKRVLNVIFVTTGVLLLLAVIFVIVVTAILDLTPGEKSSSKRTGDRRANETSASEALQRQSDPNTRHSHVTLNALPSDSSLNTSFINYSPDGDSKTHLVTRHSTDVASKNSPLVTRHSTDIATNNSHSVMKYSTDGGTVTTRDRKALDKDKSSKDNNVVMTCRVVPIVQNDSKRSVKMGSICFRVGKRDNSTIVYDSLSEDSDNILQRIR